MMRVAIAGGGGFAFLLTQQIAETANPVLVLSRQVSLRTYANMKHSLTDPRNIPNSKRTFQNAKLPW